MNKWMLTNAPPSQLFLRPITVFWLFIQKWGKITVGTYSIILEYQFYRLSSAVFYDPGFDLWLSSSEERLHVVFIFQEFHLGKVSVTRRRDKVHPERGKDKLAWYMTPRPLCQLTFPSLNLLSDAVCLVPFSQVLELVWEDRYSINTSVVVDPLKDQLMTFQAL